MNFFKKIAESWRRAIIIAEEEKKSQKAIQEAERLCKQTRRKHYVFKINHKYYVFNRRQIQNLKNKGVLRKDLDFMKLDSIAYYITK